MSAGETKYPNPNRPPKKFTKKSLHGRTRHLSMSYKDLHRYLDFYIHCFGWDMIECPESACGIPSGSPHATMVIGTGPSQYDYEGLTPGHSNLMVHWAPGELEKIGPLVEIHMDKPLEETVQQIVDHGGKLILDKSKSVYVKALDEWREGWEIDAVVEDPAGNYLYLWKCPDSRTWDELEAEYDKE